MDPVPIRPYRYLKFVSTMQTILEDSDEEAISRGASPTKRGILKGRVSASLDVPPTRKEISWNEDNEVLICEDQSSYYSEDVDEVGESLQSQLPPSNSAKVTCKDNEECDSDNDCDGSSQQVSCGEYPSSQLDNVQHSEQDIDSHSDKCNTLQQSSDEPQQQPTSQDSTLEQIPQILIWNAQVKASRYKQDDDKTETSSIISSSSTVLSTNKFKSKFGLWKRNIKDSIKGTLSSASMYGLGSHNKKHQSAFETSSQTRLSNYSTVELVALLLLLMEWLFR
jgi:hypothetical protein